jgi:hypothetical protein
MDGREQGKGRWHDLVVRQAHHKVYSQFSVWAEIPVDLILSLSKDEVVA